jgi:hypothetical protein
MLKALRMAGGIGLVGVGLGLLPSVLWNGLSVLFDAELLFGAAAVFLLFFLAGLIYGWRNGFD